MSERESNQDFCKRLEFQQVAISELKRNNEVLHTAVVLLTKGMKELHDERFELANHKLPYVGEEHQSALERSRARNKKYSAPKSS
jgi:cell division protein FtsB